MKKTTLVCSALALLLLGSACKSGGFKKTKSGLMYKIIPSGAGPVVKKGDIIKINFVHKLKDSVLANSYEQMPFYAKVDSVGPVYDPQEIFALLRKGDSAVVIREADTLAKKQGQLPEFIKPKDKLVLSFKVVDVFTADSVAQKDQMAEMQKAQLKQQEKMENLKAPKTKELEDYLAKNNIKYVKAPQGTLVVVTEPGTGAQADSGKAVSVRYTGKSFPSLKVFESNMEPGKQPFTIILGTHSVIPGWDEGLKYFKQGGKGTLYIPFYQAYGAQQGPGGTQFENLVFDVQIDNVKDTVQKPLAQMPPPPPPGAHGDPHNHGK